MSMESIKIESLMRGAIIEYQEYRTSYEGFGKWFKDIVWGTSTDDDSRDVVQLGLHGCNGWIELDHIVGVDITEDILLDYGFIQIHGSSDSISYFRDDFGYVKLDVYGIQPIYMYGKTIRYLHDFQRIFLDYKGKKLIARITNNPKEEPKFLFELKKPVTADEMIKQIEEVKARGTVTNYHKIKF